MKLRLPALLLLLVPTFALAAGEPAPAGAGSSAAPAGAAPVVDGFGPGASKVYGVPAGVSIGGYGEMLYERFDRRRQDDAPVPALDQMDFLRAVLYFGYRFDDRLLFDSEVEWEHGGVLDEAEAQVDPGTGAGSAELSGEVTLEFAHLDWSLRPAFGVRAGKLLVPVGFTNELHEPPVLTTARRSEVERAIIPTTWGANGIGVYGRLERGVVYRAYLIEGLDAAHFSADGGIRGGRQSGSQSRLTHPAFVARVDWAGTPGLVIGGSACTGNSWQEPQPAGAFLSPRVTLLEGHARLQWRGLDARGLYVHGALDDAEDLSDALGLTGSARLGRAFFGGYLEAAFDVLPLASPGTAMAFLPYARYEEWDTQEDVRGVPEDPSNHRSALTVGAAFKPHPGVVVKAERERRHDEARTGTGRWTASVGYQF